MALCFKLKNINFFKRKYFNENDFYNIKQYTGCPKKMLFSGVLAITPLWKGLEIKVGGVSKNSGNSLSDRHQNFSI